MPLPFHLPHTDRINFISRGHPIAIKDANPGSRVGVGRKTITGIRAEEGEWIILLSVACPPRSSSVRSILSGDCLLVDGVGEKNRKFIQSVGAIRGMKIGRIWLISKGVRSERAGKVVEKQYGGGGGAAVKANYAELSTGCPLSKLNWKHPVRLVLVSAARPATESLLYHCRGWKCLV